MNDLLPIASIICFLVVVFIQITKDDWKDSWYIYFGFLLTVFALSGFFTSSLIMKFVAILICSCILYFMHSLRKESKKQKPLNVYAPPDDREFEDWLNDFSDFMQLRSSKDHQYITIEIKHVPGFDSKLAEEITLEHFNQLNYDLFGKSDIVISPYKFQGYIITIAATVFRFQKRIEKEKRKNDLINEEIDLSLKIQAPGGIEAKE